MHAETLADLAATKRQLDRFPKAGILDAPTHETVVQAISAERQRLSSPKQATMTVPTPGALAQSTTATTAATASALRWFMATYLVLGSLPIWFRAFVFRLTSRLGWPEMDERSHGLALQVRTLLIVLTILPILGLTLYPAAATIVGSPIVGPAAESLFGRLGNAISYVVPLVLVSLTLVGYTVRERAPAYAFAAGLVLNLTVTLAYLLSLVTAGDTFGNLEWVRLVQFNAIATASFALLWLALRRWLLRHTTRAEPEPAGLLLTVQLAIALTLNLLVIAPAEIRLFVSPHSPGPIVAEVGNICGWLAAALAGVAAVWLAISTASRFRIGAVAAAGLTVGSLVSFGLCHWDTSGEWLGYHTLLPMRAVAAWMILGAGRNSN